MVPFAYAQGEVGPWYSQTFPQWYTKVHDTTNPQEIFGERYTNAQVQWVIYGLFSYILAMFMPPEVSQCLLSGFSNGCVDALTLNNDFQEQSLAKLESRPETFTEIILEDKPLSGVTYIKDKLSNLNIVPEVKAQNGFGYSALDMVQELWSASRNVTYSLLIVVMIVFAFMIMFRTKVSPQAVITVQSALPKLIVTIVLITFSYAIAGFMIDLMYVTLGLTAILFSSSGIAFAVNLFGGTTGAVALFGFFTDGPLGLGLIGFFAQYWAFFMTTLFAATFLPGGLAGALATLFTLGAFQVTMSAIGMIIGIIVSIMLLFIVIRAVFTLIKTFVNIILLVIVGPFMILLGAITPASGGMMGWVRNLAANLAVYPVTAVLIMVALIFLDAAFTTTTIGGFLDAPIADEFRNLITAMLVGVSIDTSVGITTTWSPPLTLGTGAGITWLWLFASMSTISLVPKVSELVKGFVSGKPFAYGTAVGEAMGPAALGFGAGAYLADQRAAKLTAKYGPSAASQVQRYQSLSKAMGWMAKKVGS